jgi:molybdopterin molybdotransferase
MKSFKDFDETLEDLYRAIEGVQTSIENVFLTQSLGRVLASDVIASENSPEYETSGMDGYAIRFIDQEKGVLKIADRLPAGTDISTKVEEGTCVKTFTGSLMSEGSDTLIPIENVAVVGDEIQIKESVKKGFQVREIGENYKVGEVLIKKGTKIGYAELGIMAELGFTQVTVYHKPKVTILSTGSEIVDIGEPKTKPAQIRSSNHVILQALCAQNGAQSSRLPLVKDDKESIQKALLESLKSNDIVITTGGVSVGDFDFVKDIIKDLEAEYIVDGAFVKPGRHIRVVKLGSKFIFALPGFPYSSAVMSMVYVLPTIRAMLGQSPKLEYVEAKILEDYEKRSKFTEFTACNLRFQGGELGVDLKGKRVGSSAIITNLLENAALLRVEKETKLIKKGEIVKVLVI